MKSYSPFGYVFGNVTITEDLSELKTNTLFANGLNQNLEVEKENPFCILDKYKYSKKVLTKYFNGFAKANFNYTSNFKITTSWMTNLTTGESVHRHNHVNSMWSAIFYFDEYTDKSCPIHFENPLVANTPVRLTSGIPNCMMNDSVVEPEHNLLIFFPSWIYHYSKPNMEKTRRSLAFNLMPTGCYGSGDSTYNPEWMT